MNKEQASKLVKETFENSFNKDTFIVFIKNLLNKIEEAPFTYKGNYIHASFKEYIASLERIGKYTDGEHKIDILIVYLKKETSIERARTMQRNYIAKYLNGSRGGVMKDAALVAFVSPNTEDWRFSLVKMDYKFEKNEKGKVKVKEEFTPARRWSFLVGENENSHTAQSRFVPLIADDTHSPTLAELEELFNIEKVTKEFFEKYRDVFLRTKEELDKILKNNSVIKNDFEQKSINTVDFAKKLLGQIVFLYFLQKKGWFGVGRNSEWGTGSKQFLRELFEKKHGEYNNFFNDILEPLFYEALRIDRSHDDHYYSRFNCKIPFLNGGLFDPINGYDWVKTDILIPNELFSNSNKTKEGDTGDGILDIFDRYNFTVCEDEPLEKEVAIDPELLGKAYEKFNAIRPDNYAEFKKALKSGNKGEESKFNKQYGVYYTPREIVHYMCQQSLINYLCTEIEDIPKEDIETLIHYGEHVSENEAHIEKLGKETDTYFYKLPESIRKNAEKIDEKLANIKVCDPAVGSGAFPVGMMTEIVKSRSALTPFIKDKERSVYRFKRECIENSLYGVDIDPGAVEIAKLRLWLSLVIDEDDIKQIKPLPNLDYKIVCGNSLLGVEKNIFNSELFKKLEEIKPHYFNETNPTKKQEYKKEIDWLISQITDGHTEFDFDIYFSEVFHEKGGFDVVIGNPPYLESRHPSFSNKLKLKYQKYCSLRWGNDSKYITKGSDLLAYFFEKSIKLINVNGTIVLITQNAWLDTDYGIKLQHFLKKHTNVKYLIDSKYRYFPAGEGPNINTLITVFVGKEPIKDHKINFVLLKDNIQKIKLPQIKGQYYSDNSIKINSFDSNDPLFLKYKWGILHNSDTFIFELLSVLEERAIPLNKVGILNKYQYGQGLNISKSFFIPQKIINSLGIKSNVKIPILYSGSPFQLNDSDWFLVDKNKIDKHTYKELKILGYEAFETKSTRKLPPVLIMPRGISKHFCAKNNIEAYSISGVDVYYNGSDINQIELNRLWIFFNSSIFWLLREISGRKNLGGGLLKSEATDLQNFPVYIEFEIPKEILSLKRNAMDTISEINTDEHKIIDELIFDALNLDHIQRYNCLKYLTQMIELRSSKAKT